MEVEEEISNLDTLSSTNKSKKHFWIKKSINFLFE
jgi:hypothetical protein